MKDWVWLVVGVVSLVLWAGLGVQLATEALAGGAHLDGRSLVFMLLSGLLAASILALGRAFED